MKMNKELKDKWLQALRSGEYLQGEHRLATVEGDEVRYCCLGVLCEVVDMRYDNLTDEDAFGKFSYRKYYDEDATNGDKHYLPVGELQRSFNARDGFYYVSFVKAVSILNDNEKLDFKDIAAYIEANLGVAE